MKKKSSPVQLIGVLVVISSLIFLGGCSGNMFSSTGSDSSVANMPPVSKPISDHPDIELPSDMELENDESMAIRTESFLGGVLSYSGHIEMQSLKGFIVASMQRNKWKVVGEASSETIMLAFTKPNKTCMVVIEEDIGGVLGNTNVYLYVTADLAAAKRLNPFGETMK